MPRSERNSSSIESSINTTSGKPTALIDLRASYSINLIGEHLLHRTGIQMWPAKLHIPLTHEMPSFREHRSRHFREMKVFFFLSSFWMTANARLHKTRPRPCGAPKLQSGFLASPTRLRHTATVAVRAG